MRPTAAPPRRRSFVVHWLMMAAALTLLAAQMSWSLLQSRQRIEAEAREWLENHSRVLHGNLERDLGAIDAALRLLREYGPSHLAQPDDMAYLVAELATLAEVLSRVRVLCLFDATGTAQACNRQELVGRNFAGRDYFQSLQRAPLPDRLHTSPHFNSALGAYTLGLSRPVYDARGEFAGIVLASLDTEALKKMLHGMHPPRGTRLSILHGDGTLLTLVPEQQGVPPSSINTAPATNPGSLFRHHLASGQPASFLTAKSAITGTITSISMRTVQPVGLGMSAPLVVAAARDHADILAPWHEDLRRHLALFSVIAAGSLLALWFYQRRQRAFERRLQCEEEQTRHMQALMQRFIDHLPGLAYVKDEDLRAQMVNRTFLALLGKSPAEVIGKTNAELFPGAFGEKISADDRQVLASGKTTKIEESVGEREYETTKFVIDDGDGPRQLGGITLDITERKAVERALAARMEELRVLNHRLEDAHHQLLQSEKMASIGQLAAGVAHEINNPIGFVGSNLHTLEKYLRDILDIATACEEAVGKAANPDDFARIQTMMAEKNFAYLKTDAFQLLAESVEGLRRMKKIVQDLKDFSRPGEAEWQLADLHQGLDSTLNILAHEIKYKCTVKKDYGDLPPVRCLPAQLNQVFMNLLSNAAQAIPEQGEITLRTGQHDGAVFVVIADTGVGIAPEHLARIFDPFFTTREVGQGTGLGLSLSYAIVQKHGGRIEVHSKPGAGTTFTVWLPTEPHPPAPKAN